MKYILSFSNT